MAPQNSDAFFEAVKARRSYYKIGAGSPIADSKIVQIVKDAVVSAPTSFNGQQTRALVLFGKDSAEFWDMAFEGMRPGFPDAASAERMRGRIDSFQAGHGTILFFDDLTNIEGLQAKMPQYAPRFTEWLAHSTGMLQYICWTALEAEGLGASLQHMNPQVDEAVRRRWDIPGKWILHAQMPFGERLEAQKGWTEGKAVDGIDERVKVFGL